LAAAPAVVALVAALAAALELPRDVVVLVVLARRPLAALPADRLLPATIWLLRALLLAVLLVVVALLAVLLVLADLVVLVAAVPLQHLLSRQSFSAAMAKSTP
jgi:hypothetical protein